MFFLLSKLLAFLTVPFNWAILLFLFFLWKRPKLRNSKILWFTVSITYLFTVPFVFQYFKSKTEYPRTMDTPLHHQIGVVLTGFASVNEDGQINFNNSADRLMEAMRLVQSKVIDTLIISGGSGILGKPELKESIISRSYCISNGINPNRIIAEHHSRNTRENARETKKILDSLGQSKVLLITSATHMKRALGCFEKLGITTTPFPVDHQINRGLTFSTFWPAAWVLAEWPVLIHEWIGSLVYRFG